MVICLMVWLMSMVNMVNGIVAGTRIMMGIMMVI